jgi:hypothetical protein
MTFTSLLSTTARRAFKSAKIAASCLTLICLTALSPLAGSAQATPVVDQQNLGPASGNVGYGPNLSRGQSFTVGLNGALAGFEFFFNKSQQFATGNAYLSVYSTDGGGAPDTLLGQVALAASAVGTTHSLTYFDLTPLGISVSVGDLMFAALNADFSGGMHSTQDLYAGGKDWACGPTFGIPCWSTEERFGVPDLVFRSHVLPEPGTLALLGLGIAGIGFTRRRR